MSEKITLQIEFEVGTLKEIGLGGLKQPWIDAKGDDDVEFSLTCGAGVGSSLLEVSAVKDGKSVYARADIRDLANALFGDLHARLRKEL